MFAEERRTLILDELTRSGRVEVCELAQRYTVSEDTIRRDLRELASQGFLQKTHGGAVGLDTAHMPWQTRTRILHDAKVAIGRAAAALVEPRQTLMLDAGLTVLELARHLTARPLHIITNALDVAHLLSNDKDIRLTVTGGEWDAGDRHLTGEPALYTLRRYRADWAFLGACAVHPQQGLTATQLADAELKRAMLKASVRTAVLADHSKFDQLVPHWVADLSEIQLLVTDLPTQLFAGQALDLLIATP